jgi:2-C-methyl-D-erythritol 4-phosphate cytidylyltransferase
VTWVVVPAAGRGTRFGGEIPKQYLAVGGEPLLAHTLRALLAHASVEGAMVVLAADDAFWPRWQTLSGKPVRTCAGGESRADSVLAGLLALPETVRPDDFVLVHDAARPNVRLHDLNNLLERGCRHPVGAILAAPVRDTLKRAGSDGEIDGTEPREKLWRALTPQLFRRLPLTCALQAAFKDGVSVTDESMAMELQGLRPLLVEGRDDNIKVTTAADLLMISQVLLPAR